MATIERNPDRTLTLSLSSGERTTYDELQPGQLDEYITLWLAERFKETWKPKIDSLSTQQKEIIAGYLSDVAVLKDKQN